MEGKGRNARIVRFSADSRSRESHELRYDIVRYVLNRIERNRGEPIRYLFQPFTVRSRTILNSFNSNGSMRFKCNEIDHFAKPVTLAILRMNIKDAKG